MGIAKDKITKALEECNLSPTVRAETLSMDQLASLANCLYKLKQEK